MESITAGKGGGYKYPEKWGHTRNEAFEHVKDAIIELLEAAESDQLNVLIDSAISPMFKGKLLYVYFPEKFAPIYSTDHLAHFVSVLNITGSGDSAIERQQALMAYRANEQILRNESVGLMMRFLYSECHPSEEIHPSVGTGRKPAARVTLDEALMGLTEIDSLPSSKTLNGRGNSSPSPGKYKPDGGRKKSIGDRGEAIVKEFEKRRLITAGHPDLADKIVHVAQTDDTKGYDISSFNADGSARCIEVKSTTAANLDRGFFLTANELSVSKKNPSYHLYFVFQVLSSTPMVFICEDPDFTSSNFELHPTQYNVTLGPKS
ncbi:MAG: hypothetical protein SynsKO_34740 [Synoicihabitans sp.]